MKRLFLILLPSFLLIFSCSLQRECEKVIRKKCTNESFSGIVKEVYFHFSDGGRGTPTMVLTDNSIYPTMTSNLICYAMPGDSIIKDKGTLKYLIKREDSTAIFFPQCGDLVVLDSGKTIYQNYGIIDYCGKKK